MSHNHEGNQLACNHASNSMSSFSQNMDELDFERSICGAAASNDVTRVNKLLEKAAQDGKASQVANYVDRSGYTALHYASRAGHTEVVAALLKHGASVNCTTRSTLATPLHRAAFCGHENVIQLLLNHNSISEGMNKVRTWQQSKWESGEISRNVGSYCCDLTLQDVDGKTPLNICVENGNWTCTKLLIKQLKVSIQEDSNYGIECQNLINNFVQKYSKIPLVPRYLIDFCAEMN